MSKLQRRLVTGLGTVIILFLLLFMLRTLVTGYVSSLEPRGVGGWQLAENRASVSTSAYKAWVEGGPRQVCVRLETGAVFVKYCYDSTEPARLTLDKVGKTVHFQINPQTEVLLAAEPTAVKESYLLNAEAAITFTLEFSPEAALRFEKDGSYTLLYQGLPTLTFSVPYVILNTGARAPATLLLDEHTGVIGLPALRAADYPLLVDPTIRFNTAFETR